MSDFKKLKSLELELVDPEVRKSIHRLHELISDEFEEFGSSGRVIRKEDILVCAEGSAPINYVLSEFSYSTFAL